MRNQVGRDAGRQRKGRAHWVHGLQIRGAGDGNRTRVMSLEGRLPTFLNVSLISLLTSLFIMRLLFYQENTGRITGKLK